MITYDAEIVELRKTATGGRVVWKDRNGALQASEAPFILCTLPFAVLRGIDGDLDPAVRTAIAAVGYIPAVKVAFQARRRFWELDDQIYGGISWTNRDITQIWYPSTGLHRPQGILVGAYIWTDEIGAAFAALSPAERIAAAIESGERIHPGYADHLEKAVSVAWSKIPYSGGAWAEWSGEARKDSYPLLLEPDGPFYFAGEHMSHVTGWQEGAVLSAHYAIAEIGKRVRARRA
jgi:monoamine oxidase